MSKQVRLTTRPPNKRQADAWVEKPEAAPPAPTAKPKTEDWSDLKAMYRLFGEEDVTFGAMATPHWQKTRSLAQGTVLLIGDTTQTDFGIITVRSRGLARLPA